MFCHLCGADLQGSPRFCPSCGKPVGAAPMMPRQGRIAGHVRLLGIFWLAMSAMHLLPGLFLMSMSGAAGAFFPPGVPFFVHGILRGVGVILLISAGLGLVT